jgi:NAD(P)-dependent dehydrogenase (short-subunit alcohol dehydrogenase family)
MQIKGTSALVSGGSSGLGAACDRDDALAAGFDAYFVKPVDSHQLEELLLGYLPSA